MNATHFRRADTLTCPNPHELILLTQEFQIKLYKIFGTGEDAHNIVVSD